MSRSLLSQSNSFIRSALRCLSSSNNLGFFYKSTTKGNMPNLLTAFFVWATEVAEVRRILVLYQLLDSLLILTKTSRVDPLVARTVALNHLLVLRITLLVRLSADTVQIEILLFAIHHCSIEVYFWYRILRFCYAVDILVRVNSVQRKTRSSKVSKFDWIHFFWDYSLDFFRRTHVTIRFRYDCWLKCTLD